MRRHPSIHPNGSAPRRPRTATQINGGEGRLRFFGLGADARVVRIDRSRAGPSRGAVSSIPSPLATAVTSAGMYPSHGLFLAPGPDRAASLPTACSGLCRRWRPDTGAAGRGAGSHSISPPLYWPWSPSPRFRPVARAVTDDALTPLICPHPRRSRRRCPLPASTLPAGPPRGLTHRHSPPRGTPVHRACPLQETPPTTSHRTRLQAKKCTAEKKKRKHVATHQGPCARRGQSVALPPSPPLTRPKPHNPPHKPIRSKLHTPAPPPPPPLPLPPPQTFAVTSTRPSRRQPPPR